MYNIVFERFFVEMNAYSECRKNSTFSNMYFLYLRNSHILRSSQSALSLFKDTMAMTCLGNKRQEYEVIKVFISLDCNNNGGYTKDHVRYT